MLIHSTRAGAAAATAAVLLCLAGAAHAHGEDDREPRQRQTSAAPAEGEGGGEHAEEEAEPKWRVGVDYVLGFGKTVVATQLPPGSASVVPVNVVESDPIEVSSILLSLAWEPVKHFGLGARFPVSVGNISPDGAEQSRAISTIGNLELEGEYSFELGKHVELVAALGVALPTAQGTEVPATTADLAGKAFSQTDYDRFSLNVAAAGSRGYEENALFFSQRFGLVPKLALDVHAGAFTVEPYVKVENMISTTSDAEHGYIGELVVGAGASYLAGRYFEPALRLWTAIVLTGDDTKPVGVVEPQLRFHIYSLTPYVGVILPFAGPLAQDPSQFVGIRAGASLSF